MGWITHSYGWPAVFVVMGLLGIVVSTVWLKTVHTPRNHPGVNQAELDYIAAGGALVNMDQPGTQSRSFAPESPKLGYIRQLLSNRMLLGVYVGQYCITTLTYFFLTWFPVYLVKERGMSILNAGFVAALPAICVLAGSVLGGLISDSLLRRGRSLTFARKTPNVIGYLIKGTGSFNAALVFVATNALVAVCCHLFVVGDIKRFVLRKGA